VRLDGNGSQLLQLSQLPGVVQITEFGNIQELRIARDADHQQILSLIMKAARVEHFAIAHPSLEDIFRRIVGLATSKP
jgi:ABC-type uncharacterized transport system ATPase subunit